MFIKFYFILFNNDFINILNSNNKENKAPQSKLSDIKIDECKEGPNKLKNHFIALTDEESDKNCNSRGKCNSIEANSNVINNDIEFISIESDTVNCKDSEHSGVIQQNCELNIHEELDKDDLNDLKIKINKESKCKKTDEELNRLRDLNRSKLQQKIHNYEYSDIVIKERRKNIQKGAQTIKADFRGSRYRGVSKNKGKWQMTVTLYHKRSYKGGFRTEIEAAREYDRRSILIYGLKARTNLSYTKSDILSIIEQESECGVFD